MKLIYGKNVAEAKKICRKSGAILSGITDEINDIAASDTDDIIIEDEKIIEDYEQLLGDALKERGN